MATKRIKMHWGIRMVNKILKSKVNNTVYPNNILTIHIDSGSKTLSVLRQENQITDVKIEWISKSNSKIRLRRHIVNSNITSHILLTSMLHLLQKGNYANSTISWIHHSASKDSRPHNPRVNTVNTQISKRHQLDYWSC